MGVGGWKVAHFDTLPDVDVCGAIAQEHTEGLLRTRLCVQAGLCKREGASRKVQVGLCKWDGCKWDGCPTAECSLVVPAKV